ncbi:MAG: acyltransferase [Gammaproteobacteria bacterium]|nr:acyltransferase [Gammaproteobacteria bacterium]
MPSLKHRIKGLAFYQANRDRLQGVRRGAYSFFAWTVLFPWYRVAVFLLGIEHVCGALARTYSKPRAAFLLTRFGAHIGTRAQVCPPLLVDNAWVAGDFSHLEIGEDAYIGREVFLDLTDRIRIGARTAVSGRVAIVTHVDTGPESKLATAYPRQTRPVEVGADCWIGFGSTILYGVTIGAGSVIAAGSLVRDPVPAGKLAAGAPATPVRTVESNGSGA